MTELQAAELEEAVSIVKHARNCHDIWMTWMEKEGPGWVDKVVPSQLGDELHHANWVKKYEKVLRVLESYQKDG